MSDEYICKWTPPYEVFDGEGGYVQTGELIRCKDCIYRNGDSCSILYTASGFNAKANDGGFCSWAERKEE